MKRIFLVEDDKAIAKNLMLLLRSEGYTVTHAPTQSEAIDLVSVNRFDLEQSVAAENHSPPARSLRRTQCTNLWVVYNCALTP